MKKYLLGASLLVSAITSFGAGYQINLEGLRQMAMGGTGTAWPWDASTIFYNPGGLGRLKNIQVYASGQFISPSTAYGGPLYSGNTQRATFSTFNLYIGGPIQQGSKFALGLGIYTPFGNGLTWNNNWLGSYVVQSVQLTTVFFQPTISYRINDFISVGAGFVYATGVFTYNKAIPVDSGGALSNNSNNGEAQLRGGGNGAGFNAGVQLKVSDKLQFGLTYRSQVNLNIGGGSAQFTVPNSLQSSFPDTHFDTQIPLPAVASFGVGYRPTENLTIQFDLNFTGWNSFDSLRINFSQQTADLQNIHAPEHYKNTLTPRIGACYKISRVVSVMAGGAYDPTPVTSGFVSPILPDADRAVVSCGLSVKPLPGFTILAAVEGTSTGVHQGSYVYNNFSGSYKTEAVTPGIGLYYSF
jgi:long-chain fatty acid transport protein